MSENGTGSKLNNIGKALTEVGCLMTLLVTLPVLGFLLLGITGLIIGFVIGLLGAAGILTRKGKGT